jgi:hypothetical protein
MNFFLQIIERKLLTSFSFINFTSESRRIKEYNFIGVNQTKIFNLIFLRWLYVHHNMYFSFITRKSIPTIQSFNRVNENRFTSVKLNKTSMSHLVSSARVSKKVVGTGIQGSGYTKPDFCYVKPAVFPGEIHSQVNTYVFCFDVT